MKTLSRFNISVSIFGMPGLIAPNEKADLIFMTLFELLKV